LDFDSASNLRLDDLDPDDSIYSICYTKQAQEILFLFVFLTLTNILYEQFAYRPWGVYYYGFERELAAVVTESVNGKKIANANANESTTIANVNTIVIVNVNECIFVCLSC
jgi:hypothetical protein